MCAGRDVEGARERQSCEDNSEKEVHLQRVERPTHESCINIRGGSRQQCHLLWRQPRSQDNIDV